LKRHVQATHRIQAQTRDRTTTSNGCGVLRKEKRRRRRLACLYMSMTNQ
jgi:predicted nucleic acid-binding Zn ribbon protein